MSTPEISNAATPTTPSSRVPAPLRARLTLAGAAKIRDAPLTRKAIVYIRQSSPQQVAENKESTARQ